MVKLTSKRTSCPVDRALAPRRLGGRLVDPVQDAVGGREAGAEDRGRECQWAGGERLAGVKHDVGGRVGPRGDVPARGDRRVLREHAVNLDSHLLDALQRGAWRKQPDEGRRRKGCWGAQDEVVSRLRFPDRPRSPVPVEKPSPSCRPGSQSRRTAPRPRLGRPVRSARCRRGSRGAAPGHPRAFSGWRPEDPKCSLSQS